MTLSPTIFNVIFAEYDYAECHVFYCYAKCRFDERHFAECRGATLYAKLFVTVSHFFSSMIIFSDSFRNTTLKELD